MKLYQLDARAPDQPAAVMFVPPRAGASRPSSADAPHRSQMIPAVCWLGRTQPWLSTPHYGIPLGLEEAPLFAEGLHRSAAPTGVLLYTDGLTEARDEGRFFGQEGVKAVLVELHEPSPRDAVAGLRARVAAFADAPLTDDLCLLAARVA